MSNIVINGKTYSGIESITVNKSGGGTAKYTEGERPVGTIEITENGTHDVTNYASANVNVPVPECDLIDVTELPTENVDESKVYRTKEEISEMYLVSDGIIGSLSVDLGSQLAEYREILVDSIDNVAEPKTTNLDGGTLNIYIDKNTGIGYVWSENPETSEIVRMTLGELLTLMGMPIQDMGKTEDFASITQDGLYFVNASKTAIAIPNAENDKLIFSYDGHEWNELNSLTEDMLVGLWERVEVFGVSHNVNFYEFKPDGSMVGRKNSGENESFWDCTYRISNGLVLITDYDNNVYEHKYVISDGVPTLVNQYNGAVSLRKSTEIGLHYLDTGKNGTYTLTSVDGINGYGTVVVHVPNKLQQLMNNTITTVTVEDLEGATAIESHAFYNRTNLVSVELPNSVTRINDYGFYGCTALNNIQIPSTVTSFGKYAFWRCKVLTSINIPEGTKTINEATFYDCDGLTNVVLPSTIKSIKDNAFSGCSSLNSINIPEGVTSIGEYALRDTALTTIDIPSTVTSIEGGAFSGCNSLTTIRISATNPPTLVLYLDGIFNAKYYTIPSNVTRIEVPSASLEAYKTATNWANYADIMVGV